MEKSELQIAKDKYEAALTKYMRMKVRLTRSQQLLYDRAFQLSELRADYLVLKRGSGK